jgi:dihydroorotate dehydrogenase
MYKLLRPVLFKLDPETAHTLTLYALRFTQYALPLLWILERTYTTPPKPVQALGLTFKNPVGLAAGYDKDGLAIRGLSALGFGHIEIGTVTPRSQPGNPKPRVFRLVEDGAVINRMGFPGRGSQYVSDQLLTLPVERRDDVSKVEGSVFGHHRPRSTVLGLNLGKNKDTPLEEAANDYTMLIRAFTPLADYLAINISSPNTVGLRRLQGRELLEQLLGEIAKEREQIMLGRGGRRPILVKLAPDLSDDELEDAVGVILACGMDGVIATNTTLARMGLLSKHQAEAGGVSGSPLRGRSEAILEKVVRLVAGRIPVVSVGGIMSPEDAKRRIDIGAALVQVYTGLVYRGPGLVKEIVKAL